MRPNQLSRIDVKSAETAVCQASERRVVAIRPIATNNPLSPLLENFELTNPPLLAAKIIYENTIFQPKSQKCSRLRCENKRSDKNRV